MSGGATKRREAPVYPQTKVTADDWMGVALRTLVEEGEDRVRILPLAQSLGVSRASFYWYFESRDDLLGRLLSYWEEKNTKGIVRKTRAEADTIAQAILHVFECWLDAELFEPRLDFAVREWARRSEEVKERLKRADAERISAIVEMFVRHGFEEMDAMVRARILYFEQIGYYSLDLGEPISTRLDTVTAYIRTLSGTEIRPEEERQHRRFAHEVEARLDRSAARP